MQMNLSIFLDKNLFNAGTSFFKQLNIPLNRGLRDALYIYRFEIMILLRVKAKSLLCYWVVRDLGIKGLRVCF